LAENLGDVFLRRVRKCAQKRRSKRPRESHTARLEDAAGSLAVVQRI
jgi:hypothetical protein